MALSLTLKEACVSSGEIPRSISIGTKIGARTAHFEVAEVMKRLSIAVKRIIPKIVIPLGSARALRQSAPAIAMSLERLELLNT